MNVFGGVEDMNAAKGFVLQSIKVKNTFIEDGIFENDLGDSDDDMVSPCVLPKRQMSEPLRGKRLMSEPVHTLSMPACMTIPMRADMSEPEKELEPVYEDADEDADDTDWTVQDACRQETEQSWPVWRSSATAAVPTAVPTPAHGGLPVGLQPSHPPPSYSPNIGVSRGTAATTEDRTASKKTGSYPSCMPTSLPTVPETSTPEADAAAGLAADVSPALATALLAINAFAAGSDDASHYLAWTNVHTAMLRNLPNKATQKVLLSELDDAGFMHTYDFLYLPIDPDTNANRGYAFINFIDPAFSMLFRMHFEGRRLRNFNSHKMMSIYPAALQGYAANHAHYSRANAKQRETGAKPLFFNEPQNGDSQKKADSLVDLAAKQLQHQVQQQVQSGPRQSSQVGASEDLGHAEQSKRRSPPMPRFCPYCGKRLRPSSSMCQFCATTASR